MSMFHGKADKKEARQSGYSTKDWINRVRGGIKNEVSKWVFCFKSHFQLSDKRADSMNYHTAPSMLTVLTSYHSYQATRLYFYIGSLLCFFFFPCSLLLETHWTYSQQVHLHISPIGYNHTSCRLWESRNFNEWHFSLWTYEPSCFCMEGTPVEQTLFQLCLQKYFCHDLF